MRDEKTRRSLGYGFVTFVDAESVASVLKANLELCGKILRVVEMSKTSPVRMWGANTIRKTENKIEVDAVTEECVVDFKKQLLHGFQQYVLSATTWRTPPIKTIQKNQGFYELHFEIYVISNEAAKAVAKCFGQFEWLSQQFTQKHGKPGPTSITYVPNRFG